MTLPTFSILTPSYNYAQFINDALESTARQSVGAQHVVVDGASTDGTADVLKASNNKDLHWISEPDLGQSDALNKAIKMATGEWIGWLNADEFYLPAAIEAVAEIAARAPDTDVIVGTAAFVDADGRFERLFCHHRFSADVLRNYGCYLLSSSMFFRRSALPDVPWDTNLRTVMDWDLFLALTNANRRFVTIRQPLSAFRVHPDQVTATPLSPDSAEHRRVRERRALSDSAFAQRGARARHVGLRIVDGCYRQELATRRRFAREDMRWFSSASPPAAETLIRAANRA